MSKTKPVLWLVLILSSFFLLASAAAPLPPRIIVNHETRECASVILGDECMDCFIPAGWEELGLYGDVTCPEGYAEVDVRLECQPFKTDFCCTEGHSGAAGDCEDLLINRLTRQCAFVEDINTADISGGWKSRPETVSAYEWYCPAEYNWQSESLILDDAQSDFPVPERLITILGLICLCGFSLLIVLVILLIILRRRKKDSL